MLYYILRSIAKMLVLYLFRQFHMKTDERSAYSKCYHLAFFRSDSLSLEALVSSCFTSSNPLPLSFALTFPLLKEWRTQFQPIYRFIEPDLRAHRHRQKDDSNLYAAFILAH